MKEISVGSTKKLEDVILHFIKGELESVPETYHDLIPDQLLPEEQLAWLLKAKRANLLPSGSYYVHYDEGQNEDSLSVLTGSYQSREEKLKKVVDHFIRKELQNIPKNIKELIPKNLTVEEKLAWVRRARDKGNLQRETPKSPRRAQNKGLGTGPFTGPGTAPGTGPGTAPWLENNKNSTLDKNRSQNNNVKKAPSKRS